MSSVPLTIISQTFSSSYFLYQQTEWRSQANLQEERHSPLHLKPSKNGLLLPVFNQIYIYIHIYEKGSRKIKTMTAYKAKTRLKAINHLHNVDINSKFCNQCSFWYLGRHSTSRIMGCNSCFNCRQGIKNVCWSHSKGLIIPFWNITLRGL